MARTIVDLLDASVARFADKVCLVAQGQHITFRELNARSNRIAHVLRSQGVVRGDRVVIYGDNSIDVAISIWGVLKADAVFSLVSGQVRAEKLALIVKDSGARVLIADALQTPHVVGAHAVSETSLPVVLVARGLSQEGGVERACATLANAGVRCENFDRLIAAERESTLIRKHLDVDLAMILYTSGSTGEPKGVMMTHRNVEFASCSVTTLLANTENDVILGVVPLSFNYGLYQWLMAVRLGATLVLERGFTFPMHALARVAETGVTGFAGVPSMFAMLGELKSVAVPDLSRVRYVTSTAEPLLPKHIEVIARFFPSAKIFSMYGLTECKRVSCLPPEDIARKSDSVGLPIPGTEFWIVDGNDQRVAHGEVGELVVRGSHVMAGYWQRPELTAVALRPWGHTGERVFYTGDLCTMDEDGYLRFVARKDEVIKSRGEKVSPHEVERAIVRIEGVRECAVVGVPDDVFGTAIKAFVVLETQWKGRYLEREITQRVGQWIEPYMVPKYVVFVDDLPKTDMGKILKKSLV
jgi:amino acid adenylation domain-containing protein